MTEHDYVRYTRGCRCAICRAAKADYMRARRAAGRAAAARTTRTSTGRRGNHHNAFAPGSARYVATTDSHGSRHAYDELGCRCRPCTDTGVAARRGRPA